MSISADSIYFKYEYLYELKNGLLGFYLFSERYVGFETS